MKYQGHRIQFWKSNGDLLGADDNMAVATYYGEFVSDNQPNVSCHLIYDGTVAFTATFESSNDRDATTYAAATAGSWVDESSIADVVIAAAAGGNMMQHVGWSAARGRVKVVVTTGGRLVGWDSRR